MPHDPDFHETAAAWLDGSGNDGAHRVLREILRDSPDSAVEFAALARAEAALHLAALTPAQRLQRARRLIQPSVAIRLRRLTSSPAFRLAAAAVIGVAGGTWWFLSGGDESGTDSVHPRLAPHMQRKEAPTLTSSTTPPEKLPPADRDWLRRMDQFILPEFEASNLPLTQALEVLGHNVTAVDPTALPSFSGARELPDGLTVHLKLKHQSVAMLVKLIAIQTGTRFQPSGRGFVVGQDPETIPVNQESKSRIPRERLPAFLMHHRSGPPEPESAASNVITEARRISDEVLHALGERPSELIPDVEVITLMCSSRTHRMFSVLCEAPNAVIPGTWRWNVKAVEITGADSQAKFVELAGETTGRSFSDPEFQLLMRNLSQMKGVDLMTLPSLTLQPGGTAHSFVGTLGSDPTSVAIMRSQRVRLLKLQGEELIRGAMEVGVQSSTIQKVYPEYLSEVAHLAEERKSGFGPRHPKILGLGESIRLKKLQLIQAAEAYTSNLKVQIENSNAMLAEARMPTEEWTGVRWTMENQTVGDSESMFQWLLEVSEPNPGAPPARSMSRGNGRLLDHQTLMVHCERTAEGQLRAFFITGNTVVPENPSYRKVQPRDVPSLLSPPNPDSPPEPMENLPYGIPVPESKGMVQSPYEPDKGLVDVSGLKRGTRVQCPYSGKHFRVP